ncbi:MAG: hypothetical protein KA354_24065, partial [Phycisphaerae bacterium]|nr:hypothetical protein [Phycisphaerae bacterium]
MRDGIYLRTDCDQLPRAGGGDSGYNGRTMKHFLWEAWRGNPEARDWFVRWADGWRDATMREF